MIQTEGTAFRTCLLALTHFRELNDRIPQNANHFLFPRVVILSGWQIGI